MALGSLVGGYPHAALDLHSEDGSHMFLYSCATHIINFYQHENLMWKLYCFCLATGNPAKKSL